jgi:hypothetical protein
MAIYIKSVLAGVAGSIAALVLFVPGVYLLGFIRMIWETQSNSGFSWGVGRVEFSGLLPLVFMVLGFIAGFCWMVYRQESLGESLP